VRIVRAAIILGSLAIVTYSAHVRWTLARDLAWHCDEIPLLMRFTGLNGQATTEREARQFEPSFYSWRTGAVRSLGVPNYQFSPHTSTGFWVNLTTHLLGYGSLAGRAAPLAFSIIAIVACACAAWIVTRSGTAACLTGAIVALSPANVAYGAQARGYAEAIALTPLLLLMLENLRRRPDGIWRGPMVLVCAIALCQTVYTAWLFWVIPAMLAAWAVLPEDIAGAHQRRVFRCVFGLIVVALLIFMVFYTAARWKQFVTLSTAFGERPNDLATVWDFIRGGLAQIVPGGVWLIPFVIVGAIVIRRGEQSWWLAAIILGILAPTLWAVLTGSAGYIRNLTYLTGPLAILASLGIHAILHRCEAFAKPARSLAICLAFLVAGSAWAWIGLPASAQSILLPDWGAWILEQDRRDERQVRRWLCPCLANHWQIDWYEGNPDASAVMDTPIGGQIEVMLGAQLGDDGKPKVFRRNPDLGGIHEDDLPGYLAESGSNGVRHGIEIHRWLATRIDFAEIGDDAGTEPILVVAELEAEATAAQWQGILLAEDVHGQGVVEFATAPYAGRLVQTLIAPAQSLPALRETLVWELGSKEEDIHVFRLQPIASPRID